MNDFSRARARASLVAEKYLGDCQDWPTQKLVGEIEAKAYQLAREGNTREANSLFIVVADLSTSRLPADPS